MATPAELFHAEVGQYLEIVSPDNPVGVCTSCLLLRTRAEVAPGERCPASLLRTGLSGVTDAEEHAWERFTDRAALEAYVKTNGKLFGEMLKGAATLMPYQPAPADD